MVQKFKTGCGIDVQVEPSGASLILLSFDYGECEQVFSLPKKDCVFLGNALLEVAQNSTESRIVYLEGFAVGVSSRIKALENRVAELSTSKQLKAAIADLIAKYSDPESKNVADKRKVVADLTQLQAIE